jgi:arginine decarboxylase
VELKPLQLILADKVFCNFSVFQSLPDSWAIGQQFPVMPLHRLGEQPSRRGILQDITCDSDGQIASYIGAPENSHVLPLHAPRKGEPYYLGIFLTGAYQEILGELHNLFGGPNVIHVALDEDGGFRYEQVIHGENVERVLSFVEYPRASLMDRLDRQVKVAVKAGRMTPAQGRSLRSLYEEGLAGLPYMEAGYPEAALDRSGRAGSAGSGSSGDSIG